MAKDLTEALRLLTGVDPNSLTNSPEPLKDRGAAAKQKASTLNTAKGSASGIASPLVETLYADREFHTAIMIASTDGLFTLRIKPVKKIFMKDATNSDVVLEFKSP